MHEKNTRQFAFFVVGQGTGNPHRKVERDIKEIEMDNRTTEFFKPKTRIKNFIPLPRFVLSEELTASAKLIYGLLVARTMLSQKAANAKNWTDKEGRITIMYTIENLARDSGLSVATVKASIRSLKKAGLVISKANGHNKPNTIYVKYQKDESEDQSQFYPPAEQNEPQGSQNYICPESQNQACIYTDIDKQMNETEKEIGVEYKTVDPDYVSALINGLADKFNYNGNR